MRMTPLKSLLVAGALAGLPACAGIPDRSPDAATAEPKLQAVDEGHYCLKQTGSRIPAQEGKCLAGAGRVLYRADLERTGSISLDDALRRLLVY